MANASAGVVLSTSHAVRNVILLPAVHLGALPPAASLLIVTPPPCPGRCAGMKEFSQWPTFPQVLWVVKSGC